MVAKVPLRHCRDFPQWRVRQARRATDRNGTLENSHVTTTLAKNIEVHCVPMNEVLTQTIQDSTLNQATSLVFRNRQGQPYRHPHSTFAAAARRAGITDLTFHDIGYTFLHATRRAMVGVTLAMVKELRDHKRIALVLHYAPRHRDYKRLAIEVLSGGVGKSSSNFHNTRLT
jgi:integrase